MHEESKKLAWLNLKPLLIARFHTVNRAADIFGCTPRGLRGAAEGTCPRLLQKLRAAGVFRAPQNLTDRTAAALFNREKTLRDDPANSAAELTDVEPKYKYDNLEKET
jgi:hypothetical protein